MKHVFLSLTALSLAALTACVQPAQPPAPAKPTITALGKLELRFDVSADGQSVAVRPQAVLGDSALSGLVKVAGQATDDGAFRYVYATYQFTNATAATFDNLTFYAYNQSANNIGGTAIKNLSNFVGGATAANAQQLLPTHATTASGGTATILSGREDFQGFTPAEAAAADSAATPSIIAPGDTVLEYGFVARGVDTSGNPTGSRSIAPGAQGRVNAAYKFPFSSVPTGTPYSFTATFVVANETATRVTRSPEETTAAVASRAAAGNEVVLIGSDSDTVTNPVVTNIRLPNAKIGTAPSYLLGCPSNAPALTTTIPQIQGTGSSAALSGVQTVEGVIVGDFQATGTGPTQRRLNGFYIQDPVGDGNPATSDAIFVFEGSDNTVVPVKRNVGDFVRVTGTVAEFRGQTQLTGPTITACAAQDLPAPVAVSFPVTQQSDLERFEGMRVAIAQTMTVTETFTLGRYGMLALSSGGRVFQPTNVTTPGASANAQQAANAQRRIWLDDGFTIQNPNPIPFLDGNNPPSINATRRIGDTVTGFTGVLTEGCAASCAGSPDNQSYRLFPTQTVPFVNANPRSPTPESVASASVPNPLKVAASNVLNYFNRLVSEGNFTPSGGGCTGALEPRGANNATEFTRQRTKTISALKALDADVLGLIEMQNNGSGTGSAVKDLVDGLNAATAPNTYAIVDDSGINVGCDAIKVAIIYKPARVAPLGAPISDNDPVYSRPPVAQTFRTVGANAGSFTFVMNHFKSKGSCPTSGPDTDQGDGQSCWNDLRKQQAARLKTFLETLKARTSPTDNDILTMGDYNAYLNEDPLVNVLEAAPNALVNLTRSVDPAKRYSYVFDGQSGNLDHALVSSSLAGQVSGITEVHWNADEPTAFDYNVEFKNTTGCTSSCFGQDVFNPDTPYRFSDHDPVLVGLGLTPDSTTVSGGPTTPTVSLSITPTTTSEATPNNTVTITATASSAVTGAQTVNVAVTGTGITASDYSLSSSTITIPSGSTTGSVTLTVLDDTAVEGTETATITLSSPSSGITLGSPITVNLTINDNDAAPAARVVISQFQVAGATAGDEFIELHNISGTPYDLNGHVLVYRSAAGTSDVSLKAWTSSTVIPAGGYYLVTGTPGYAGSVSSDTTFSGGTNGSLSGTSGGLAVRNGAANTGTILDSVGYGAATNAFVEGATTTAPANSQSKARGNNGCTDTNSNSADFITLNPSAPRNSSTTAFTCP